MIDPHTATTAYLIERTPLTTLTSDRIWGGRVIPIPGYTPAQGGAITFVLRGGDVDYAGVLTHRMQFKCYGDTPESAYAVYMALYGELHEAITGTFKMALCETLGQPLTEQEKATPWPFVLTFFRMWFLPGD